MSTGRTEKDQVRVHIRWMIRRDMPEVLQTEQESFEFAWTEEDDAIGRRISGGTLGLARRGEVWR